MEGQHHHQYYKTIQQTPMNLSMNYHFMIIILWKKQKVEFLTCQSNAVLSRCIMRYPKILFIWMCE